MSNKQLYKQCRIERVQNSVVVAEDVRWLPVEFAEPGRHLVLKKGQEWIDGWIVRFVSDHDRTAEQVAKHAVSHNEEEQFEYEVYTFELPRCLRRKSRSL